MHTICIVHENRKISQNFCFCEAQNKTSKYTGVSWHKDKKSWQANLMHNKKNYFGGYFDNEEHAAMKINLLCDKYGIERKNPMIVINLYESVIHSLSIET